MDIYKFLTGNEFIYSWPEVIGAAAVIAFAICCSFFLYRKGKIKSSQAVFIDIFAVFMTTIFILTVFGRVVGVRRYQLRFLWSYERIFAGSKEMLREVILNILMLMPAGALLPAMFGKKIRRVNGLLLGIITSSTIELLQLATCTGLFEFDDIFHNSLGCMLGCILGNALWVAHQKRGKDGKVISKGD